MKQHGIVTSSVIRKCALIYMDRIIIELVIGNFGMIIKKVKFDRAVQNSQYND